MPRSIAINVGANTNAPGFRGPIRADGRFEYVPIPESEPVAEPVPTYADLDPGIDLPAGVRDTPVHLDPEFPEYPHCKRYTYGDEHGVKAGPLSGLRAGDYVFFYATLSSPAEPPSWMPPDWGAYLIGQFRLALDPVTGQAYRRLDADQRARFDNNAHVKREVFDARVLLSGDPDGSALYDRGVPLSTSRAGVEPNRLVTEWSEDSGKGPWWRRPLRFDGAGTRSVLSVRSGDGATTRIPEG